MRTPAQQRGMTLWGVAMIVALIVLFTLLFLKLLPPYMEHGKVTAILKSVASQPMETVSKEQVRQAMQRRFDIDDISRVNLKTDLFFEKGAGGSTVVRIVYEVRVPLTYNISAVLDFDERVEIRAKASGG